MNCAVKTVSDVIIKCRGVCSTAATVNVIHKRTFGAKTEDLSAVARKGNWGKVVRDAEKIVGYPTSFLNLRWIMTDEIANVALHLRQLSAEWCVVISPALESRCPDKSRVNEAKEICQDRIVWRSDIAAYPAQAGNGVKVGTGHPLLVTAKNLLYEEQTNVQLWGLAILLLANAVKSHKSSVHNSLSIQDDVSGKHRMLAELTEMIKTGHLIHQSIVNLPKGNLTKAEEGLRLGNKIGLLTGDYLLVKANSLVAQLRNQDLTILISSAMRDLSVAEFVGDRGPQNVPLPSRPKVNHNDLDQDIVTESYYNLLHDAHSALGNARSEWTVRSILTGGSLLGRGCQSAMLLSNQPESVQAAGYMFGCHLALAWQSASELKKIISPIKEQFSLVSAPVLFALESYPEWYEYVKVAFRGINNFKFEEFKVNVNSSDAIQKTKDLCQYHSQRANNYLNKLEDNDAVRTLRQIVAVI